jgi:DnaJ domain
MTSDIKGWFSDLLAAIDSVRTAKVSSADTIVISTWSGVLIHAYLVDQPIKARAVKRIVQENTRVGVGTLFAVDAKLVPDDGAQVEPDEGLLALHALFKDKLYTYRVQDDQLRVGQVHFKVVSRGEQREVWYGPDVPVRHLPCYRVWVKTPQSVKGNWLIANFGSEAFWKQADYTLGREAFRQQRRSSGETRFYTWSNPGWNDSGGYTTPAQPPETELDRCYKQLGLTREATGEEVKAAFRRLAREVHPDVSSLPKDEAEARFKKLYDAYSFIKATNGW